MLGDTMSTRLYSDIVAQAVERFNTNTALFIHRDDEYKSWSYNQFHTEINQVATSLLKRGFKRSDNAMIIGSNTPEWIIAFHAIFFAGRCSVPVDPNLPREEIEEILRQTDATAVFCDHTYVSLFSELKQEFPSLDTIVQLTDHNHPVNGAVPFETLLTESVHAPSVFTRSFSPDDAISILFTSGTTGQSKGVVLTQKNYCTITEYGFTMMGATTDDRIMAVLPLYHVFGFASTIAGALMNGVDVVCIPEINGQAIVKAMNDLSISALPAVPQMLTLILENIKRSVAAKGVLTKVAFNGMLALSRIMKPLAGRSFQRNLFKAVHEGFGGEFRLIISGGASLDPKSFKDYQALGFDIVEGYGLTETFGPITLCPIDRQVQGSVGELIGKNEGMIADPDSNGWGEVLFRGDAVFSGYLNNAEATSKVFNDDGWFKTGDRGRYIKGMLYLSGRLKDVIVLDSGKNVYPDELEHYYETSEFIKEIAVFELLENNICVVAAVVVPMDHGRSGTDEEWSNTVEQEMNRLSENRPDYKRVGSFVLSAIDLPRTSTKKVKKHLLPDLYKQLKSGRIPTEKVTAVQLILMESEPYQSMLSTLGKSLSQQLTKVNSSPHTELLRDLGIDSLRLLDIVARIEKERSIMIEEDALVHVRTLEELCALITAARTSNSVRTISEILERAASETTFTDKKGVFATLFFAQFNLLSSVLWRYSFSGVENIPIDRPVIFAANHESMFDGGWLYGALPGSIRKRSYSLVKEEILNSKLLTNLFSGTNLISVERENDAMASLKLSYAALKSGKNVIIFPEGTRSTDGNIHEFRSGIGILLKELDVSVVPVRIENSGRVWPKGSSPRFFSGWKQQPSLKFGKPLSLEDLNCSVNSEESVIAEAVRRAVIHIVQ